MESFKGIGDYFDEDDTAYESSFFSQKSNEDHYIDPDSYWNSSFNATEMLKVSEVRVQTDKVETTVEGDGECSRALEVYKPIVEEISDAEESHKMW